MSKKTLLITIAILMIAGLFLFNAAGMAQAKKPKIGPICMQCHAPDEKILRGTLTMVVAETIQMQAGPATWLVKFVPAEVKVIGAKALDGIPRDREIAVTITEIKGEIYTDRVSVKQPAKIPEAQLIKTEQLAKLIAEKADMVLADSRPAPRFHEGHIPGAISIYDADFDKHVDKLPIDKGKLLVFYCGGVT